MNSPEARPPARRRPRPTRVERKEETRRAIIAAALGLLDSDSFASLSLREVTREAGIVPTAFYRHFASMEALGLVLIDESFSALRNMLREGRAGKLDPHRVIESSVEILVAGVTEQREHWRFISRERYSGVPVLRHAIRGEIALIVAELAADLSRFPRLGRWTEQDRLVVAGLFVNTMIVAAEAIEEADGDAELAAITRDAVTQMRMVLVGIAGWRSSAGPPRTPG